MIKSIFFVIGITSVASEAPSLSEYNRAKTALKEVLPQGGDLPRAVRLGK